MKKWILLTVVSALPLGMMAQDDDMYFVPTKENVAKEARNYGMPKNTYYTGSQRSVDDYNRRVWSSATPIDSVGNDIIDFSAVRGVYPDSAYAEVDTDDYQLTRRMSRFDGYTPSEAYWEGYRDGNWSSPWYYSRYYGWYDPWYWDDPWFYGSYYGWYSPWHYGYYGYYRPWGYYGWYGPRHIYYGGSVGHHPTFRANRHVTQGSRAFNNGGSVRYPNGSFGGRDVGSGTFGTRTTRTPSSTHSSGSFGGSLNSSGSSFGGSRSSGGGSFSGGGRSGGGGRFGR